MINKIVGITIDIGTDRIPENFRKIVSRLGFTLKFVDPECLPQMTENQICCDPIPSAEFHFLNL